MAARSTAIDKFQRLHLIGHVTFHKICYVDYESAVDAAVFELAPTVDPRSEGIPVAISTIASGQTGNSLTVSGGDRHVEATGMSRPSGMSRRAGCAIPDMS